MTTIGTTDPVRADKMDQAADELVRVGHVKGTYFADNDDEDSPCCMQGALIRVGMGNFDWRLSNAVAASINSLFPNLPPAARFSAIDFNDWPTTTQGDCVLVLRHAAAKLRGNTCV